MTVLAQTYMQPQYAPTAEFSEVEQVAGQLLSYLNSPIAQTALAEAHIPRAHSTRVQASFSDFAGALGFRSEATGLFAEYKKRLRPDYYRPVPPSSGILLEVERGKTVTNNMDLLDFWKCHLCVRAHYLFLLVPQDLQHGDDGMRERPYTAVMRRLSTFFREGNYTNVRGLFLFGY